MPLDFRPLAELAAAAKADSLWQLLVLQGALDESLELLAYEAPTYYGMAVAVTR
jgi:aromatic ring-opening dioxygenase LigB subunit